MRALSCPNMAPDCASDRQRRDDVQPLATHNAGNVDGSDDGHDVGKARCHDEHAYM